MKRREFLQAAACTVFGGALNSCSRNSSKSNPKQLNLYSWADYFDPDTIPEFERRTGIHVVYDTFASNEALLAKLQAGGADYDIIIPTSYMVRLLKKMGKLSELDHGRLVGLGNLMERFRNPKYDPHLTHCVPYTWGTTGIAFNSAALSATDWPTNSDVFWDEKFKHRITLLDDPRETIGMSLKRRGLSFNDEAEHDIRDALSDLIVQKPLTMCYTSDQVIVQLTSGDSWVSLIYSGDAYQAQRDNPDVKYIIPRAGASIWLDNFCIPVGAPHPENAYKWINYMLEPAVSAKTSTFTRYATPNEKAYHMLNASIIDDKNLYPSEKVMSKCEEIGDVGNAVFLYDRCWTELKCI